MHSMPQNESQLMTPTVEVVHCKPLPYKITTTTTTAITNATTATTIINILKSEASTLFQKITTTQIITSTFIPVSPPQPQHTNLCTILEKFNQILCAQNGRLSPLQLEQTSTFCDQIDQLCCRLDPNTALPVTAQRLQRRVTVKPTLQLRSERSQVDTLRDVWLTYLLCKDGIPASSPFFICTRRVSDRFTKQPCDLATYIGGKPLRQALFIMLQLAYIIDYLHNRLGVAHMDINAHNVIISQDDDKICPKLIGFGKFCYGWNRSNVDTNLDDMKMMEASAGKFPVSLLDDILYTLKTRRDAALQGLKSTTQSMASPYHSTEHINVAFNLEESFECFYPADKAIISFDAWAASQPPTVTRSQFFHYVRTQLVNKNDTGAFSLRANCPMEVLSACCEDLSGMPKRQITRISSESFGTMAPECLAMVPAFRRQLSQAGCLPRRYLSRRNISNTNNNNNNNNNNASVCNDVFKADVFSLGLLFYFVLTGSQLYTSADHKLPSVLLEMWQLSLTDAYDPSFDEILSRSGHDAFNNSSNPTISGQLRSLLTGMLQIDSVRRFDIKAVIRRMTIILSECATSQNHQ